MKKLENTMNIVLLITVSSTMILIFTVVIINLLSIKDYTIIAGLIGFVGAIIGGSITLIGVTRTIEADRVIANQKRHHEELMFLYPLEREIEKIITYISVKYENDGDFSEEKIVQYIYEKFSSTNLYEYAQRGSLKVYSELISYRNNVEQYKEEYDDYGYLCMTSEDEMVDYLFDGITDIEEIIRKEIDIKVSMVHK
ncbi:MULTISPECIES: hypothetical protein [unclassified Lysinibacillus]|uniref:hypothetical protein n=1 Tax=unclassified Lysinibacillus TaxID=2636778 RepID=UPI00381DB417